MGFPSWPEPRVIIIGGGVSGIAMACQLIKVYDMREFCIYDRQVGLGGTWLANTYPGCAVDIPGFCYSFSFEPCSDFTQMFPPQREILKYLSTIVKKYRIDQHFTGRMEWTNATWQEKAQKWVVTLQCLETKQTFTQECEILISAVGGLVNPQELKVPGVECFQGEIIHTARWNPNTDLANKNVAVIGNGASAAQLVPAILDKTKSVTQFMRSQHHFVEAKNHKISQEWRDRFNRFPLLLYLIRFILFLYMELMWFRFQKNGIGKLGRASIEMKSRDYVQKSAPESYWNLLIPSFEFGCKRRIFDRGYLATLSKKNMCLKDDPIIEITKSSILTKSGQEVPIDIIVLANGFSLTQYDVNVQGRQGKTREQHWKEYGHKATFKTVAMHGFPNFFYILGPNSGRLYTSTIQIIESEVDMVIRLIRPIMLYQAVSVEVKSSSERNYDKKLHQAIDKTVHDSSCGSYLIDKGSEKNWFVYPWNTLHLWFAMYCGSFSEDWMYRV